MQLMEVYAKVRSSVVALASRVVVNRPPTFPEIIGTGFVVDSSGVVATNRHVVEALRKLPPHPETGQDSAFAIVWSEIESKAGEHHLGTLFVGIRGYNVLERFVPSGPFYGEEVPDLAFVRLNVCELPRLSLVTEPSVLRVGMPIATAGFPLGTDAVVVYKKITQITPLLRHGIVSSLYPFPCPNPHGFTIDAMTQGGASGSPIFLTDSPTVVGILHAGFPGTNITIAVPSAILAGGLAEVLKSDPADLTGVPTLKTLLAESERSAELKWDTFVAKRR